MTAQAWDDTAVEHVRPHEGLPRVLAGLSSVDRALTLDEHLACHGEASPRRDLIGLVEASGLQGRGGAGFPTGAKLRAVAAQRGRPTVVVNAAEGESVSGKDKVLVRYVPHLVLDGAVLAAQAVGASEAIVAVGERARVETVRLNDALRERKRRGLNSRIELSLATIPDGFVAGEETAVINVLNGGAPKPTFTPPRPFERGVGGAPTLVQNAETLAHLALIARFGPGWFRELGTPAEPGSALVTVSGAVGAPGVYEVALGLPLRDLITQARGASEPLRALLVGGYFGSWIDIDTATGLRLLNGDLRTAGASLGARAVVALPASACGVCETARAARYLADESAGQCGPCVHGLDAIANGLERIAGGAREDNRLDLLRWVHEVRGRGACRHPDGAAGFVASALTVFAPEVDEHIRRGRCSTGDRRILPLRPARGRA